jgi:hypothetical protein
MRTKGEEESDLSSAIGDQDLDNSGSHKSTKPGQAKPPGRFRFWVIWVVITAVGWIMGTVLGFLLVVALGLDDIADVILAALAGFVACAMQALALLRRVPRAGHWVVASSVAWILVGVVTAAGSYALFMAGGTVFFVLGAMIGATQWLVVQRQASGVWLWLAVSAAGWGLGLILSWLGIYSLAGDDLVGALQVLAGGVVAGPITGAALAYCLRKPSNRPADSRRMTLLVGVGWLLLVVWALVILLG